MHQPIWLSKDVSDFPPTSLALSTPNGLLAVGGDLSPKRLINAYSKGIFPWYSDGNPILWWSPDPRMVFYPDQIHCSKSLKKFINKAPCSVSIDCDFESVIQHCREIDRPAQNGTWISTKITLAYIELHRLGIAHSIETRDANGVLIGGFYGLALGAVFFGESMFSLQPNASKIAITQFGLWAKTKGFQLIDCQVENPHLRSIGGQLMPRPQFESILLEHGLIKNPEFEHLWRDYRGAKIFNNVSYIG
jgi:leucyl/phenylalanyl-tRNA--protein transferase